MREANLNLIFTFEIVAKNYYNSLNYIIKLYFLRISWSFFVEVKDKMKNYLLDLQTYSICSIYSSQSVSVIQEQPSARFQIQKRFGLRQVKKRNIFKNTLCSIISYKNIAKTKEILRIKNTFRKR